MAQQQSTTTDRFEIQTVDRAFGPGERIPESMWRTVGRSTHPVNALRRAERERKARRPQPGAWTGHVRILRNGVPVRIEDYGQAVYEIE